MTSSRTDKSEFTHGRRYRGRFAPSPTGPLHLGSLVAAIASYAQALSQAGQWLLRIEDIDPPREVPGAADQIIRALAAHGFEWHDGVLYQSENTERLMTFVTRLLDDDVAYPCVCSREQVRAAARAVTATGPVYPGTCRSRGARRSPSGPSAVRIRTEGARVHFEDLLQGRIECDVEREIGDFIIRRKDGLIAYSLAGVVDDRDQQITQVVRGADLLDFTPAQIYLQQALGFTSPIYCHVPVVVNESGHKLSKQSGATPIDNSRAPTNLVRGLEILGQRPPPELAEGRVADVWEWTRSHWTLESVRGGGQVTVDSERDS